MTHFKRKQMFVDRSMQGALVLRAILYWALCLVTVVLAMACWRIVTGPSRPLFVHLEYLWFHYKPAAIASTILLPLVILDMIRFSNRVAGPLVRLRGAMRRLADGRNDVAPLRFRKNDFMAHLANEFDRLAVRVQRQERKYGDIESVEAEFSTDENSDINFDPPEKTSSETLVVAETH